MGQPLDAYQKYYKDKLEDALEFQDHVADVLYREGLPVVNYQSRAWQVSRGENRAGVEIKFDTLWRSTGNLYIETAEKSHPNNSQYVASGIYREDNGWLVVIGDYEQLFIFQTTLLQALHRSKRYREVENQTKTSLGMLLPIQEGEKYAAKVIRTPNEK